MSDLLLSPYGAFAGAVSLLWLALYFLLRRRKRARVTMAAIWQRLAAKKPKPPLRSRFKQTLSVVVGFALIFAMTLWVGGTIAPQEGTPASREPVDLVIVLDTSPSTLRLRRDGQRNLYAIINQARRAWKALAGVDRVWLMWKSNGVVQSAGPILGQDRNKMDDLLLKLQREVDADFETIDYLSYRHAIAAVDFRWDDEESTVQGRRRLLTLISDHDDEFLGVSESEPWFAELGFDESAIERIALGADGFDYRFSGAEILSDGRLRLSGFFPEKIRYSASGREVEADSLQIEREEHAITLSRDLPAWMPSLEIELESEGDAIPENNRVEIAPERTTPPRLGVFQTNSIKFAAARLALIGLELGIEPEEQFTYIDQVSVAVCEEVEVPLPSPEAQTRAIVCFGTLPRFTGLKPLDQPASLDIPLGSELILPSELIGETTTFPFAATTIFGSFRYQLPAEQWTPLLLGADGLPVVAFSTSFGPTLLWVADRTLTGPLMNDPAMVVLLTRWLRPLLLETVPRSISAPLLRNGDAIPVPFEKGRIEHRSALFKHTQTWEWLGPSGRTFTKTWAPGTYRLMSEKLATDKAPEYDVAWFVDPQEVPNSPVLANLPPERTLEAYRPARPLISREMLVWAFLMSLVFLALEWLLYRSGWTS